LTFSGTKDYFHALKMLLELCLSWNSSKLLIFHYSSDSKFQQDHLSDSKNRKYSLTLEAIFYFSSGSSLFLFAAMYLNARQS